ncbi:hypothetical protein KY314_05095 [Candidatus Woesearchaeota archaeon]|nr:hypothetical protein [Candidatus Woesearchaeota archaeon]
MKIVNKKNLESYSITFMKTKIKTFSYNYTIQFENPPLKKYFNQSRENKSSVKGAFIRITFDDLTQKDEEGEITTNASCTGDSVNCRISVTLIGNITPRPEFEREMQRFNLFKCGRKIFEYELSHRTRTSTNITRTTNIPNAEILVTKIIDFFQQIDISED